MQSSITRPFDACIAKSIYLRLPIKAINYDTNRHPSHVGMVYIICALLSSRQLKRRVTSGLAMEGTLTYTYAVLFVLLSVGSVYGQSGQTCRPESPRDDCGRLCMCYCSYRHNYFFESMMCLTMHRSFVCTSRLLFS